MYLSAYLSFYLSRSTYPSIYLCSYRPPSIDGSSRCKGVLFVVCADVFLVCSDVFLYLLFSWRTERVWFFTAEREKGNEEMSLSSSSWHQPERSFFNFSDLLLLQPFSLVSLSLFKTWQRARDREAQGTRRMKVVLSP